MSNHNPTNETELADCTNPDQLVISWRPDMTDGEIAVRQSGTTTAVAAPSLDGTIDIDLDAGDPVVGVPEQTNVRYEDTDAGDEGDDARTDGGAGANRVDVEARGYGLGDETAAWAMGLGGMALLGGGYLLSTPTPAAGVIAAAAGGLLSYIGTRSRGGEFGA